LSLVIVRFFTRPFNGKYGVDIDTGSLFVKIFVSKLVEETVAFLVYMQLYG
jgi:hypothetical protein